MGINQRVSILSLLIGLFGLLMLCATPHLYGQNKTVSGTVTDAQTSESLPGVNILVVGTSTGAATDGKGHYSVSVPSLQDTLRFSFIGYKTENVPINGRRTINIKLKSVIISGNQLVVVGFGTQKEKNLTGSVSTVNFESEGISSRPMNNVSSSLAGMVPGLSVRQSQGNPSANGSTLRIRGVGSLNSSQAPLVLINGVPGNINLVNPNDVANISVLKGAAAAAIYGSRASNGVILITTKKGENTNGKITLDYKGVIGFAKATRLFPIVDKTANQMKIINRIRENSGLNTLFSKNDIQEWRKKNKTDPVKYPNTNWWDALLKPNIVQTHNVSASGGTEKLNFYSSFRFRNNNGLVPNTAYSQYNFRADINYDVNDWLKIGADLAGLQGSAGPTSTTNAFQFFNASTPSIRPVAPDGRYGAAMTAGETQANNSVKIAEQHLGQDKRQQYKGHFTGTIDPVEGLEVKGSYFIRLFNRNTWSSSKPFSTWNFQNNSIVKNAQGSVLGLSNSYTKRLRRIFNATVTYQNNYKKNNFKVLAGYDQAYNKTIGFNASGRNLLSLSTPVLSATTTNPNVGGNNSDFARRSYFGRFNYNYNEKYLFEVDFRADGSSKFAPGRRWGYFPSFSAGWILSSEPFWNNIKNIFNYFKIRGSWGKLGNNGIGNYAWQSVYHPNNYSFNGNAVSGVAPTALANSSISWETTKQYNIGLDFNVLNNNLNFTLDYYNKLTENILAQLPIPFNNGGLTPPTVNSAEVRNSGINAKISYSGQFGDLSFRASVNGAYNKNRIVKYKNGIIEPHGAAQVWTEGEPIGVYRVLKVDHIVQDQSRIDNLVNNGWEFEPSTPGPGDFLYKNMNGDKKINDEDRVLEGHPIPLYNFGGSINFGYKGFDLHVIITGVAGWDKYLNSGFFTTEPRIDGYLYSKKFLHSWTPQNHSTTVPKLYTNTNKNDIPSDYFLYDSSYLRFKTIQFGYTLPVSIVEKAGINKIRVYVDLENYITLTPYPGMDPEASASFNGATYPLVKTLNFGLNIKL
jgi:TonB-linked SusC/RagA family outer membrane protein